MAVVPEAAMEVVVDVATSFCFYGSSWSQAGRQVRQLEDSLKLYEPHNSPGAGAEQERFHLIV